MVKECIYINGNPFYYEKETLNYDVCEAMNHDEAKVLLRTVKKLFDEKGLDFYLAFGTLLGAIREHDLISGDEDLDIFIDNESKLLDILSYLSENGLKLIRALEGNTYSFRLGTHSYIDVYILRPIRKVSLWKLYCYALANEDTPKKFFKEYQDIEFLGDVYKCPRNPEKIIEFWYGKNWKTPVRGHKFIYDTWSHHVWWNYIWLPTLDFINKLTGYRNRKNGRKFKK